MTSPTFAAGAYAAAQGIGKTALAQKPLAATGASGFSGMLSQALDSVAQSGARADTQALTAAAGKANVVDVVTAVAESETAIATLVSVRDRVIQAYQTILQMPI